MKKTWIIAVGMLFFMNHEFPAYPQVRPKIGLVLSGGGARGFGHIGTLKMLDSLQIPVDCIAGTSMGGIVGALYALGYSGIEIEKLIQRTDWEEIFTDSPPRNELPYFQKKDTGKYQLEFGLKGLRPVPPSGLIFGQKISLLFSGLTFPYENIKDFNLFPIPFRCMAIDLVTGDPVVLKSGSLSKAIRATMAIPTVFSPVEWGDSLLVDGGMINNLPVDVVKEMGADIVIAVDVGSPLKKREQLNNAIAILQQSIAMIGIDRWKENMKNIDILIQPDLTHFTLADFKNRKIGDILQRGDSAARLKIPQLKALKEKYQLRRMIDQQKCPDFPIPPVIEDIQIIGYKTLSYDSIYQQLNIQPFDTFRSIELENRISELKTSGYFENIEYEIIPLSDKAIRLIIRVEEKRKPIIHGISITGNRILPFSYVYQMLGLKPADQLDTDDLNRRIMQMYGLGYFEYIQYFIEPRGNNRVHLTLRVKEHPKRKLRFGLRYDDMYTLIAAIGVQGTNFLIPGLRYEHELQFPGLTQYHFKTYYPSRTLDMPLYPYLRVLYKNIPINIYDGHKGVQIASYKDKSITFGLGFGLLFSKSMNLEIEYQHEAMDITPDVALSDPLMFPSWDDILRKIHISMVLDRLDDALVPRYGFLLKIRYEASLKGFKSDYKYELLNISLDCYYTLFQRHTLRLYGYRGTSESLPIYKYLNQGRPYSFVGMAYDQLFGTQISILRTDYRFQVIDDFFIMLMANVGFDLEERTHEYVIRPHDVWGFGTGLKVVTPIGPIEMIFSRGDKNFVGERKKQNVVYFIFGMNIGKYLYD